MITRMSVVDVMVLEPVVATVGIVAVMLLLGDLVRRELRGAQTEGVRSGTLVWGLLLAVVFVSLVVLRFNVIGAA